MRYRRSPIAAVTIHSAPPVPIAPTPCIPVAEVDALLARFRALEERTRVELDAAVLEASAAERKRVAFQGRFDALRSAIRALERLRALEPAADSCIIAAAPDRSGTR